ncbi:MAG: hypothetical protein L0Y56_19240 [Nitrospira sp.]|nr:hypothetical protein [Nitrospira sp.]
MNLIDEKQKNLFIVVAVSIILVCLLGGSATAQTLTSISIDPSNPTIVVGQTQQFIAMGTFSDGSSQILGPAWTGAGNMREGRSKHTATLLPDGRILMAGGRTLGGGPVGTPAELYNPTTGNSVYVGAMSHPRF